MEKEMEEVFEKLDNKSKEMMLLVAKGMCIACENARKEG